MTDQRSRFGRAGKQGLIINRMTRRHAARGNAYVLGMRLNLLALMGGCSNCPGLASADLKKQRGRTEETYMQAVQELISLAFFGAAIWFRHSPSWDSSRDDHVEDEEP